jgi:hypothetical protein
MLGFSAEVAGADVAGVFAAAPLPCAAATGGTTTVCVRFDEGGDCADEAFEALAAG